jgi:hypothetical protein
VTHIIGATRQARPQSSQLKPSLRLAVYIALSLLKHLEQFMMDVVMLAIGFAFFALSIAYVYACDLL